MPAPRPTARLLPVLAASIPATFLLAHLHLPLMEDALFWWVPRALKFAEQGLGWVAAGDLPAACQPDLPLPPQWAAGIPDYGHPPTWFWYLSAWIRLPLRPVTAVHLACVPWALGAGFGILALSNRLCPAHPVLTALPALLAPPLLAQVLRPDTDLPLLCCFLWALVALWDRRPLRFALWATLATTFKEPGVLLALPGLTLALRHRRFVAASIAPVAALGGWALLHHAVAGWGLAGAERLPESAGEWLRDAGRVLQLVAWEQGRGALLLAWLAAAVATRSDRLPANPPPSPDGARMRLLLLLAAWTGAFSGVNFLGGRNVEQGYTHVRYLLPAITLFALLATSAVLVLARGLARRSPFRLFYLVPAVTLAIAAAGSRAPHPRGPEANLFQRDLALAWQRAVPEVQQALRRDVGRVWVGSYLYTALTRPYAGLVQAPLSGLQVYGYGTDPEALRQGDRVVQAAYGEPLGRLGELELRFLAEASAGAAWVRMFEVTGGRRAAPARNLSEPSSDPGDPRPRSPRADPAPPR